MRLITWNCKGAFNRKHSSIASLNPDVLILPECERLQGVNNVLSGASVRSFQWIGENPNKGLGVVSYSGYELAVHPDYDPDIRWVLPLEVHGPDSFLLLAVWTIPDPTDRIYIHALFRALERYERAIGEHPTISAGDFNQSVRFDKPGDPLNFARWMTLAERLGLRSAYHLHTTSARGHEPASTFFLYHAADKGHHIDFVFASQTLLDRLAEVTVGGHSDWAKLSDHMPLQCTFASLPT